jgi:hypothetical protein
LFKWEFGQDDYQTFSNSEVKINELEKGLKKSVRFFDLGKVKSIVLTKTLQRTQFLPVHEKKVKPDWAKPFLRSDH